MGSLVLVVIAPVDLYRSLRTSFCAVAWLFPSIAVVIPRAVSALWIVARGVDRTGAFAHTTQFRDVCHVQPRIALAFIEEYALRFDYCHETVIA